MRAARLGLTAFAAMVVALVASGSAVAANTKLCRDNSGVSCLAPYATGTVFTGTGMAHNVGPATCNSTFKFELGPSGTGAQPSEMTAFGFSLCTNGCTVSAVSLPWKMPIEVSASPNGVGRIRPVAFGGNPGLMISGCQGNCVYTAPEIEEQITGGTTAIFKAGITLTNVSGSSCWGSINPSMVHEVPAVDKASGVYVRT
jgi:hypothetical protein